MKCVEQPKWLAYLRGELGDAESREMGEHLSECPRCRMLAEELTQAYHALDALDELEPDPGFSAKVAAKVLDKEQESWWQRGLVPAIAAAAGVLAVALGVFLGHNLVRTIAQAEVEQDTLSTAYYYYEAGSAEYFNQGGM